jgi:hypothetical protein
MLWLCGFTVSQAASFWEVTPDPEAEEPLRDPTAAQLSEHTYWQAFAAHKCHICGDDLTIQVS